MSNLRLYLEAARGRVATDMLFDDIETVVLQSLRACQGTMINDKHCFEMYGYDLLVDEDLKPWLIEVNASPSLTTTTKTDRLIKVRVINDVMNAVVAVKWNGQCGSAAQGWSSLPGGRGHAAPLPHNFGSFYKLYDESEDLQQQSPLRSGSAVRR